MANTVLVTGANRGIGLEFVKQYLQAGDEVIACARNMSGATELQTIINDATNASIMQLDVTNEQSVATLAADLNGRPIDILINNAGTFADKEQSFSQLPLATFKQVFETNLMGVFSVIQSLLANVLASQEKKIVAISSILGSITHSTEASYYAYRSSKAALNMLIRTISLDVKTKKGKVFLFHPGWVQTDMGGSNAMVTPTDSVNGIRRLIDTDQCVQENGYYDYQGKLLPW